MASSRQAGHDGRRRRRIEAATLHGDFHMLGLGLWRARDSSPSGGLTSAGTPPRGGSTVVVLDMLVCTPWSCFVQQVNCEDAVMQKWHSPC